VGIFFAVPSGVGVALSATQVADAASDAARNKQIEENRRNRRNKQLEEIFWLCRLRR
jgi:hypothetical protein